MKSCQYIESRDSEKVDGSLCSLTMCIGKRPCCMNGVYALISCGVISQDVTKKNTETTALDKT